MNDDLSFEWTGLGAHVAVGDEEESEMYLFEEEETEEEDNNDCGASEDDGGALNPWEGDTRRGEWLVNGLEEDVGHAVHRVLDRQAVRWKDEDSISRDKRRSREGRLRKYITEYPAHDSEIQVHEAAVMDIQPGSPLLVLHVDQISRHTRMNEPVAIFSAENERKQLGFGMMSRRRDQLRKSMSMHKQHGGRSDRDRRDGKVVVVKAKDLVLFHWLALDQRAVSSEQRFPGSSAIRRRGLGKRKPSFRLVVDEDDREGCHFFLSPALSQRSIIAEQEDLPPRWNLDGDTGPHEADALSGSDHFPRLGGNELSPVLGPRHSPPTAWGSRSPVMLGGFPAKAGNLQLELARYDGSVHHSPVIRPMHHQRRAAVQVHFISAGERGQWHAGGGDWTVHVRSAGGQVALSDVRDELNRVCGESKVLPSKRWRFVLPTMDGDSESDRWTVVWRPQEQLRKVDLPSELFICDPWGSMAIPCRYPMREQPIPEVERVIPCLCAAPMVCNGKRVGFLDYVQEYCLLVDAVKRSGLDLRLQFSIATKRSLTEALQRGHRVLHVSSHGVEGNGSLVLELEGKDTLGVGALVRTEELEKGLVDIGQLPQVVVLSCCYSENTAKVFTGLGIPHVIAVKQSASVVVSKAMRFTRFFYHALLQGSTVRTAFSAASVAALQGTGVASSRNYDSSEDNPFVLLPLEEDEQGGAVSLHDRVIFPTGSVPFATTGGGSIPRVVTPDRLPSFPRNFVLQQKASMNVMKAVGRCRLVQVVGAHETGKSVLVRGVAGYVSERRRFQEGVHVIYCRADAIHDMCDLRDHIGRHLHGIHRHPLWETFDEEERIRVRQRLQRALDTLARLKNDELGHARAFGSESSAPEQETEPTTPSQREHDGFSHLRVLTQLQRESRFDGLRTPSPQRTPDLPSTWTPTNGRESPVAGEAAAMRSMSIKEAEEELDAIVLHVFRKAELLLVLDDVDDLMYNVDMEPERVQPVSQDGPFWDYLALLRRECPDVHVLLTSHVPFEGEDVETIQWAQMDAHGAYQLLSHRINDFPRFCGLCRQYQREVFGRDLKSARLCSFLNMLEGLRTPVHLQRLADTINRGLEAPSPALASVVPMHRDFDPGDHLPSGVRTAAAEWRKSAWDFVRRK